MTEKSFFCPSCHSPMVKLSVLAGGEASCDGCGWKGDNKQLLGHEFDSGFTNPEEILKAFANDVKMLLARNGVGVELGRLILKWGFVQTVDAATLTRYMIAVARGIASAVMEERRTQEKERLHAS